MRKLLFLLMVSASLIACSNKKKEAEPEKTAEVTTTVSVAEDSAAIRQVILDFYNWYTPNYEKLMDYQLYKGVKKPHTPPYQIDWPIVDKYQAYLRQAAPQLGEDFYKAQKSMLAQADSAFKVDLEEELPYGFDYDWYTNSQEEPSYFLDGIKASKKWMIQVKGEDATVEIEAPESENFASGSLLIFVGLKKENGQWKIARIGND